MLIEPSATIVAALIRRGSQLLMVEVQGPDDRTPAWMLPDGQVEPGEAVLEALRHEVVEETGLLIVGEPLLAFEVQVAREGVTARPYRALTYACEATGNVHPADPDGLVRQAAWVAERDALDQLALLEWYECEPLRRFLAGEALTGAVYGSRRT